MRVVFFYKYAIKVLRQLFLTISWDLCANVGGEVKAPRRVLCQLKKALHRVQYQTRELHFDLPFFCKSMFLLRSAAVSKRAV